MLGRASAGTTTTHAAVEDATEMTTRELKGGEAVQGAVTDGGTVGLVPETGEGRDLEIGDDQGPETGGGRDRDRRRGGDPDPEIGEKRRRNTRDRDHDPKIDHRLRISTTKRRRRRRNISDRDRKIGDRPVGRGVKKRPPEKYSLKRFRCKSEELFCV